MITQLLVLFILIMLNAFFAATEIAFISVNDARIAIQAKEGNKKAKQIEKMLSKPSKFLATIQIGITLAGFLSSAFASDAFADKLAPFLNNILPFASITVWRSISIILITMILSYFTLVFGELVPKRIAMKNPEKIAFLSVGIVRMISIITAPFVKLLTSSTNVISKLFGVGENEGEVLTEEEIRMMVAVGGEKGVIKEEEQELINNVFEFNDKTVSEIMTHRTDIYAIEIDSEIEEILDTLDEYKYSRIPVYKETIDEIVGVLYIKDLFKYVKQDKKVKIKTLMRPAYYVSSSKYIDELFAELQKNKMHIAVIVDEYGGTEGIVTMEDILEELVGNIFDEYDDVENEYEKIDENTFLINGSVSIFNLKKILDVDVPEGDYDTLSGYLLEELGRVPDEEEHPVIETKFITYRIEEQEDNRILKVKACRNK